jgi:hypothetical protein
MSVRLKFTVAEHKSSLTAVRGADGEWKQQRIGTVILRPVTSGSAENQQFYQWTPSGQIEFGTINEAALDALPLGAEVYVALDVATPATV